MDAETSHYINCLKDGNKNVRRRALHSMKKNFDTVFFLNDNKANPEVLITILRHLSDNAEGCREICVQLITDCISNSVYPLSEILLRLTPILISRLGSPEQVEPSEEIRLALCNLINLLLKTDHQAVAPFVDDIVTILHRLVIDPYPEVRKVSCENVCLLSSSLPQQFYNPSSLLIKPLLLALSHQHARVRVAVIKAIGATVLYGQNKFVEDVTSHLAQRLFDQAPTVRSAVSDVVGQWLLELTDRYSFFHRLLPLMLTCVSDEVTEIRESASSLWNDIGLKYLKENEEDFKDDLDFSKPDPEHYPRGVSRPNFGCRMLTNRVFSRILPPLLKDLLDWVVDTRIKSSQLLYTLLLNEEENVTMHIQKLLDGLYRAACDEEAAVRKEVRHSAALIGYFVDSKVWCPLVFSSVSAASTSAQLQLGTIRVLSSITSGCSQESLQSQLPSIIGCLSDRDLIFHSQVPLMTEILTALESLVSICSDDCCAHSYEIFFILLTASTLSEKTLNEMSNPLLEKLALLNGLSDKPDLSVKYGKKVIDEFTPSYENWVTESPERQVVVALLTLAGPKAGVLLEHVLPVFKSKLEPTQPAEIRFDFLALISKLLLLPDKDELSQNCFVQYADTMLSVLVLPNCVWHAGRTAGAIRTTAVSCIAAILDSGILTPEKLDTLLDPLLTQLLSLLEDDNSSTRLTAVLVLTRLFRSPHAQSIPGQRFHSLQTELLKRLDDSSNEIRIASLTMISAYIGAFPKDFNPELYKAHLELIYGSLLIHMDDPETKIQDAAFDVLKTAGVLHPKLLIHEAERVKDRHRTQTYCDDLCAHLKSLLN